jgi:ASC-1-like (ASCH) protein
MEEIGIESSLVDAIREGEKTVEIRLGKPRFLRMQEGDKLSVREDVWQNGETIEEHKNVLQIRITQILHFETLVEALEAIDFQAAIPSAKTIDDALAEYRKIYSESDEEEFGVVVMMFEPTDF